MSIVSIVITLTLLVVHTRAGCPTGCKCVDKYVECTNILKLEDIALQTEFLNLSSNGIGDRITLSKDAFSRLIFLQTLILSHNQLQQLPQNLFDSLTSLSLLDISDNPLQCNCKLVAMVKGLLSRVKLKDAFCYLGDDKHLISSLTCSNLPDTCSEESGKCHRYAVCKEEGDSSICTCNKGFSGNGVLCKDVDECRSGRLCHPKAHCYNTPGSYKCSCFKFYKGNGTYCEDIDDCVEDRCKPDETCENIDGGFNCNCHRGFTKAYGDPHINCRDINECTERKICSDLVKCTNTYGSYHCSNCPENYLGDGETCNIACNVTECGVDSKCFDIHTGPLCRCPIGMYNHTSKCIAGTKMIKVEHFNVQIYFTRGLRRFNSPAFLEVAKKVEPIILSYMNSYYSSIVNIHITKIIEGEEKTSTSLVFVLLIVDEPNRHSQIFNGSDIQRTLGEGINDTTLDDIYAHNSPNLNVQETNLCELEVHICSYHFKCVPLTSLTYRCECEQGYILRNGYCVKNRIVRMISIALISVCVLLLLIAGVLYVRKKRMAPGNSEPTTSSGNTQSFYNPSYDDRNDETSL